MRFSFTEDQLSFCDALRDLLERECPPQVAREDRTPELWKRLAEMGVIGVRRELGEGDLVLLLEEAGRAAAPGPLVETAAVAVPLLAEAASPLLDPVAAGDAVVKVEMRRNRVASVLIDDVDATPGSPEALDLAFDRGAFGAAAELLGIAGRLIEMGADHARQREQFGKPIGSFQAVKHLLADALIRLEFAKPAVYRAAHSLAHEVPERSRDVSMAKALASDACTLACRNALQVHGAIGYTEEHDLHVWLKLGWSLALAWGTAEWHRERVAEAI